MVGSGYVASLHTIIYHNYSHLVGHEMKNTPKILDLPLGMSIHENFYLFSRYLHLKCVEIFESINEPSSHFKCYLIIYEQNNKVEKSHPTFRADNNKTLESFIESS